MNISQSDTFQLKRVREDFLVSEVPLEPPRCEPTTSTHTYLWLRKSGYTTFEVTEALRGYYHLGYPDVAASGLKDEDGVTRQLFSIKKIVYNTDIEDFNRDHKHESDYMVIESIAGHGTQSLSPRQLHGNTFRLVVRNLEHNHARQVAVRQRDNRFFTYLNYYDSQRFGKPGQLHNTPDIGHAIVEGNWLSAYREYCRANQQPPRPMSSGADALAFFRTLNPAEVGFFVSSYESRLWNQAASSLFATHCPHARFHDVPDVGTLAFPTELDFSCPAQVPASGYNFDPDSFEVARSVKRRPLLQTVAIFCSEVDHDELNPRRSKLTLHFSLATGGYATMVVRQLLLFNARDVQ
jgi:tRNA pseudouridine13 synthase